MNSYSLIVIGLFLVVFALDTLADYLNLTRLHDPLPEEFKDSFDEKKYAEALSYQKDQVTFAMVKRSASTVAFISFVFLGGLNWVDQWVRTFGWGELSTGLCFVGVLSVIQFLASLPFSIYHTFILEEKYGFNKTTVTTFVADIFKGALLGSILGSIVFAGILYFFNHTGQNGWLFAWIAVTAFQIVMSFLAPAFILPLFNKFEPIPDGELKTAIEAYAKTRGFKLNGIFKMDSSKRSTKSNAFFTGFGSFRRLVLFDTLISKQTTEELVAVIAHEVGHFERKHIIKSMFLSIGVTGVIFYLFGAWMNDSNLFLAFQMAEPSTYASIILIGLLCSPFLRFFSLVVQYLSRKYEFEADHFSAETYGHPDKLIAALKKLTVDNLSHLTPHPLKVALDYTHPPVLQRIRKLREKGFPL